MTRAGRWFVIVGLIALATAFVEMLVVYRFGRHLLVDDQTLQWYVARDYGHLHLHQPNFYGQAYGDNLESLPTEILRWFGVSMSTGLPLVSSFMMVGCWFVLALLALRRRRFVLAALAAGGPLLLTAYYSLFSGFFGLVAGRLLATAGVAVLLAFEGSVVSLVAGTTVAALGAALDTSAAILVLPVLAYCAFAFEDRRRRLALASGLVPAALWFGGTRLFYRVHPDYALHPAPGFVPVLTAFRHSIAHPSALWSMYAPELAKTWVIPIALTIVAIAMLVATRKARYVAPGALAFLILLYAFASPRALDNLSPLLPSARILLALPLTVWVLAFLVAEARPLRISADRKIVANLLLAGAIIISTVLQVVVMPGRIRHLVAAADAAPFRYPLVATTVLYDRCRYMDSLVSSEHAGLVVLLQDRASSYGCAALAYGRYQTLMSEYERRTWILYEESERDRTGVLIWNVPSNWCRTLRRGLGVRCRVIERRALPGVALLRFSPRPVIPLLRRIGVYIRPFGPGCVPAATGHCRGSHS